MHLPLDEEFLRWAEKAVGPPCLIAMIDEALSRVAPANETRTEFLNRLKIRGHWQRAIIGGAIESYADLATVIRVAELPVVIDARQPWHLVKRGDEIAVVLGARSVDIPEVSQKVRQRGVGARDTQAQAALANACRRLGIEADLMPHLVPSDWPASDAEAFLGDLYIQPSVGAVVVLGSPVVNPLAEILAAQTLGDMPSPARFRWCGFDPGPDALLSVPREEPPAEEGILVDVPKDFFPRTRDDEILDDLEAKRRVSFPDCGLLLIDAHARPLRILCAGHGGCGTVAAVETLADHAFITRLLAASANEERSLLGPGRVLVVVTVERSSDGGLRAGGSPIDDLVGSKRRVVWCSTLIEELDI